MNESAAGAPVVLITGAAGGVGRGLLSAFLEAGWRIAAGWHREPLSPVPEPVLPVQLDVTSAADVARAVGQVLERFGRLDVLVNNAGVTADRPCWQITDGDWERVLAVNLRGPFLCARAVLPAMIGQRQGHILNMASFAARTGPRGQASYAAAKAGLVGLTESLAREVGGHNIRVNAVMPGVLPTPMTDGLSEAVRAGLAAANTLGRLNAVEEVARFVAFLAGLQNVSGQVFQLDSRVGRWT